MTAAALFEGFSLAAPSRQIVERVVAEELGAGWRLAQVGKESNEYHALPPAGHRMAPGRAWQLNGKLRKRRELAFADPLFRVPGIDEPEPPAAPARGRATRGSGGDGHQPCSKSGMWALSACSIDRAWQLQPPRAAGRRLGEGIVIAHPDTGYTDHPQLVAGGRLRLGEGYDFYSGDADPRDDLQGASASHGTSTGSVIVSAHDPAGAAGSVHGVAPAAELVPLRITDWVALFSYRNLSSALAHAADRGHHVVSISLGGVWSSDSLQRALRYATDRGVVVVAAAGNSPAPAVVYPAKYEETVAVCATSCTRAIWRKACEGDDVDVSAPGESVWRAVTGLANAYEVRRSHGTSYAAAIVAGAAALWLAYHGRDWLIGQYGAAQLATVFKEVLMTSGVDRPAGWNPARHGAGILNAEKLLQAPLPDVPRGAGFRGLRAAPGPRRKDDAGELARFVPAIGPIELRRSLTRHLHTTERELGAVLAEHGDELAFQLAIDPALRARVEGSKAGRRAGRRSRAAAGAPAGRALPKSRFSPGLRRRLALP